MSTAASLARTAASLATGGTLAIALETRNIVVAQGIQFTNADNAVANPDSVLPKALVEPVANRTTWAKSLRKRTPLAIATTASGFEYTDLVQRVKFVVSVVITKDAFRNALLTPDTHVVYDGHARYGRGPCFGVLPTPDVVSPTEDWENGTNSTTTGIFRMGHPFIGVPVDEVLHHGYTCDLVEASVVVKEGDCDPETRPYVSAFQSKLAVDLDKKLPARAKNKSASQKWLAYLAMESGKLQWHVLLRAGWTGTVSAPADLGATTPKCKVFCHFGCSTFIHNHVILRGAAYKSWKKTGDDHLAYFTTNLSSGPTTSRWLYHLFTYPKMNAFLPWELSIDYAFKQTNNDLAMDNETFRLI